MVEHIRKTVDLKAPIERVWRALSDPAQFGAWFRVKIDTPFVAGEYARGHMTYPGYEHIAWEVRIVAMEQPTLFSFTWHPYAIDPNIDYSGETPTLVEFHLKSIDGGTHLTITETGFENVPPHRMPDALRMNDNGWATQAQNIKAHVES